MANIESAGGARIFYDEYGNGPALLLIAGRIVARRGWDFQVPTFARHYRTLTIDNRDAGESDPASADYTVRDLAADCVALLDALGIARAHVLGHSMGSGIAARLVIDLRGALWPATARQPTAELPARRLERSLR
jgi:pimeloyl-ACP methyl ester carboxylesterase